MEGDRCYQHYLNNGTQFQRVDPKRTASEAAVLVYISTRLFNACSHFIQDLENKEFVFDFQNNSIKWISVNIISSYHLLSKPTVFNPAYFVYLFSFADDEKTLFSTFFFKVKSSIQCRKKYKRKQSSS